MFFYALYIFVSDSVQSISKKSSPSSVKVFSWPDVWIKCSYSGCDGAGAAVRSGEDCHTLIISYLSALGVGVWDLQLSFCPLGQVDYVSF